MLYTLKNNKSMNIYQYTRIPLHNVTVSYTYDMIC